MLLRTRRDLGQFEDVEHQFIRVGNDIPREAPENLGLCKQLIAESRPGMSQIPNAQSQGRLILGSTLSIPRRPAELG
jgi:hypothetical protein